MTSESIEIELARVRDLITDGGFASALDYGETLLEDLRRLLKPIANDSKSESRSAKAAIYAASFIAGGFGRVKNIERLVAQIVSALVSRQHVHATEKAETALAEWRSLSR